MQSEYEVKLLKYMPWYIHPFVYACLAATIITGVEFAAEVLAVACAILWFLYSRAHKLVVGMYNTNQISKLMYELEKDGTIPDYDGLKDYGDDDEEAS